MKFIALALSLVATSLLMSCQHSPQKNYFLLNSPASTAIINQNSSTNITRSIGIGPIVIADYLNRLAIVRTQDDNSLQISDTDYWGEPLDKGIARLLADTLRQRIPGISFVQFPYRSDARPAQSLRVQIHNLNYNGSQAGINATWELIDSNSKQVIARKNFAQISTTAGGAADIARAYSNLLNQLANDMASSLNMASNEK